MNVYVALLRGINVGGNNLIKMPALRACFESQGFSCVATYIASGNVLFECGVEGRDGLEARIEAALAKTFDYRANVVLRTRKQLESIVARAKKALAIALTLLEENDTQGSEEASS